MTGRFKHAQSRPIAGALAGAAALAAAVLPLSPASAASTSPGSLKLTLAKVVAGDQADSLGWSYLAPRHAVAGTVGIDVPAGFTAPQASSPASPGYVSATSACAQFQVTGTTGQADGSTVITIAVNCKAQQTGTVSYTAVAGPAVAAKYTFAATFTPAASTPVPFVQPNKITVRPGPLASLTISPATATIATGGTQAYTAQGADAFGNSLGDVTGSTHFTITTGGSCTGPVCTATTSGPHTVTATKNHVTGTATLTVATDADLSVSQTVDNTAPYYYQQTTFTTTVTNTSTVVTSDGVTATVNEPGGLVSPTATPSSTTSYDASTGTWTIGTLAPGASATLTLAGPAGAVSLGSQTVTGTVTAATPDPSTANNTASAAEASQPAPVAAVITPSPDNPPFPVDISTPGDLSWSESFTNAINPAAPAPADVTTEWECSTASTSACPDALGLDQLDVPVLSITINDLSVDTYTITLLVEANDPNYQTDVGSASVIFQTTAGE